jgi:hypothetical protein
VGIGEGGRRRIARSTSRKRSRPLTRVGAAKAAFNPG